MFVAVVVFYFATKVIAQDQSPSTITQPPLPFLDLFTSASSSYVPIRKTYSDGYHVKCPKSDSLASLASVLGSVAKIIISLAVIAFLKMVAIKFLLLPVTVMILAKMGLKALLLWPIIKKMKKYFTKTKKNKSRMIVDCSERLACVLKRFSDGGFVDNFRTAFTFSLIDDVDDDGIVAKTLLSTLIGDKVAECMLLDCNSGSDIR